MSQCPQNINSSLSTENRLQSAQNSKTIEDLAKARQRYEDQIDYQFIQRVIQELTQSCALPLPIPAASIPPLIIQAAQYFWQNCDQAIEERYYCLPRKSMKECGPNITVKLPQQIVSVFGVYKLNDSWGYGALGDFSLERMILSNSMMAAGVGSTVTDVWGSGTGYGLTDVTAALYEVSTYKAMFDTPLTFNYNEFSNDLVILGDLGQSDLILQCFLRLKLQDLYKNYYFFRYVVGLGLKSMATIMGTFEFKLPGGITINYSNFRDMGEQELQRVDEWITKNHACDYFINSNTI